MAKQSTDDLAAFIIFSSQTWVDVPSEAHAKLSRRLLDNHQISIRTTVPSSLQKLTVTSPYISFLKDAFSKRLDSKEPMIIWVNEETQLWVNIPTASKKTLWFGFMNDRVGVQPSIVIIWIIFGGTILTIFTSLLLVRRLTLPLQRLYSATKEFANHQSITLVPEKGPHELVTLTRSFNQMTKEIHELMENRTTLLAGISHDLRTPITRMQLATEMLNQDEDPKLVKRIKTDLDEMAELIQRTLEVAKGFNNTNQEVVEINITDVIEKIIEQYPNAINTKLGSPKEACKYKINLIALRRVLTNILENAITYAGSHPIDIHCFCEKDFIMIEILDRGPGIPEDKIETVFQPFHRLEKSRNKGTGGSGLGLAIVKQLCKANSWKIKLIARNGGGVTAQLTIPKVIKH